MANLEKIVKGEETYIVYDTATRNLISNVKSLAPKAKKLGTTSVGSSYKPVYINSSKLPAALSATIGSATAPAKLNNGEIQAGGSYIESTTEVDSCGDVITYTSYASDIISKTTRDYIFANGNNLGNNTSNTLTLVNLKSGFVKLGDYLDCTANPLTCSYNSTTYTLNSKLRVVALGNNWVVLMADSCINNTMTFSFGTNQNYFGSNIDTMLNDYMAPVFRTRFGFSTSNKSIASTYDSSSSIKYNLNYRQCFIPSEFELFGCRIHTYDVDELSSKYMTTTDWQFDLLKYRPSLSCIRYNYWLRDRSKFADNYFCSVSEYGGAYSSAYSSSLRVRPCFYVGF